MAYIGKFRDRTPCLRPAGKTVELAGTARDCLRKYNLNEYAHDIAATYCNRWCTCRRADPLVYASPCEPLDTVKELVTPELQKSRFDAFREKFAEDMYYKHPGVGEPMEPVSTPEHVNNYTTTFGMPPHKRDPLYEVIMPRKPRTEVDREYLVFHDGYKKSHEHFLPSEQFSRYYDCPFDPHASFGIYKNVDPQGVMMRKILKEDDKITLLKLPQRHFLETHFGRLGKGNYRFPMKDPHDMCHGVKGVRDGYDAQALTENLLPDPYRMKFIKAFKHLDKIRNELFGREDFHIHDLRTLLHSYDEKKTGFLNKKTLKIATNALYIHIDWEKMAIVLRHFHLIKDEGLPTEGVSIIEFLKLMQIQYPLPLVGRTSLIPRQTYGKDTAYREFCRDIFKRFEVPSFAPPRIPAERHIVEPEQLTEFQKKIPRLWPLEKEPTFMKDLINPDIAGQFGLLPSDFHRPRTKTQMREIFETAVPETHRFDNAWSVAIFKYKPKDDLLTVLEFQEVLNYLERKARKKFHRW